MHATGIMIGAFEPLHLGHVRQILTAAGQIQTLHIIITPSPAPHPSFGITLQDKARWLQMAFAELPFIRIHLSEDRNLPTYDMLSASTVEVEKGTANTSLASNALRRLLTTLALDTSSVKTSPALVFIGNHPLNQNLAQQLLLPVVTLTPDDEFDTAAIARDPVAHWSSLYPEARGDYTKTVAIVGGESSGKTTLVHKLANYYGASFALEMGRLYVGSDLGGTEVGLQYSDYAPIALDHAQAIREAKSQALAPVTIIDTDFVTTQAFCEEYEGRTHPFVSACIDEFRADFTIMLDNNTPWVDDGMRSLGTPDARGRFEQRLVTIFERHAIDPYMIDAPNYDARYRATLAFIDSKVYGKPYKFIYSISVI